MGSGLRLIEPTLSPRCKLYPPACKPYGLEAEQEAGLEA
jgi:putative component of membrane protein insertase Oxa1/YidC/SpoIIIJ protein YidD